MLSSKGARLTLDSNDYEEKLREIGAALNRIPKYMETPEFKKAIENTQRLATTLGNMAAFGRGKNRARKLSLFE